MNEVKPLQDRIIVEPIEEHSTIILLETPPPTNAKALAIGPDVEEVEVGDIIKFPQQAVKIVEHEGKDVYLVRESDVLYKEMKS